ncbi:hypothetical protein AKJ08_1296 [Vulgatibacter incomptus]|uniref:Uncharacterized protein n=1 Tax=Vulgatibacter incomptus TaxID=1391653 RepID=A0A0K1PCR3_9BACT|nr:hypothetical protein AKJ08_1296 [Vulgatibacter incomptus]
MSAFSAFEAAVPAGSALEMRGIMHAVANTTTARAFIDGLRSNAG